MIRFATPNDAPKIMKFIDDYWKKNHILARDEKFFRYFYQDGENLNFVIAEDEIAVNAILGFVPYANTNRDVLLALWKANHTSDPLLGMKLLDYLNKNGDTNILACVGINPKTTIPLYEYLGYKTGKMKHWYRLNKNCEYKIAVVEDKKVPPTKNFPCKEFSTFEEMTSAMDMEQYKNSSPKPYKENWYIKKRYFDHPVFKYYAFGVEDSGKVRAVFFYRVQECNNSRALRLIDCIGDCRDFEKIGGILDTLLERHKAEYVDIYEVGVDDEKFFKAGFLQVEGSGNIIPNYFAPYEAKNVDIYYCTIDAEIILFNGDGDQDRPS